MEKVSYRGWSNCHRLANDEVELIVTGDVGPRVIRFAPVGGDNLFKEFDDMMGRTDDEEWLIYGGHRFWHAPEEKPRTYYPDNAPVEVTERVCAFSDAGEAEKFLREKVRKILPLHTTE